MSVPVVTVPEVKKKPISLENVAIGALMQMFVITSFGQPFEVVKTHMAANRSDNLLVAIRKTYARGGITGFWQGLIPWAWIEASTKGSVLLFASSEIEYKAMHHGCSRATAGLLGGMGGGVAQAYTTMGFCTFMKTVEVTRLKQVGDIPKSTFRVAYEVFQKEGIRGLNKGVSAVAVRQMTNWGSRFGISRLAEKLIKGDTDRKLSSFERILSSAIGGTLACWNNPIEVIRVEMQSQVKQPGRPEKLNIYTTAKYIYHQNGVLGFFRGITPRVCLSAYATVCMVFGGDKLREFVAEKRLAKI